MDKKIIEFNKAIRAKVMPNLQAGDVVKVHLKIKEGNKERVQVFEGLVIAIKGRQSSSSTITIRKVSNGVGVEMILPLFSPNIQKIDLVKRAKVRRAKLYYVRNLTSKQSRMKYKDIKEFIKEEPAVEETVPIAESKEVKTEAEDKVEETAEVKE